MAVKVWSSIPQYPNRAGNKSFMPRKPDYGDGGAYPEIHIAQFPLGVGRKDGNLGLKIFPVDAVVKQIEKASKFVNSQHRDLVPKILRDEEEEDEVMEEEQKEIEETTLATKMALEKIVNLRLSAYVPKQSSDSKFIKHKRSQESAAFNSGAKERVIRMIEMPVDPLGLPKFKHKRVPRASGSPPVPIMHSPQGPVTVKDQQDWKIPPCISNWKNAKGYTIPLDKRLAPDGRGLQGVQINDNFAALSEALYVADQKAREAVATRTELQKEKAMKEKERREHELRALAEKARGERTGEREQQVQRDKIREERRRERRLEAKDASMRKRSKITRDGDRDVSEKVALGMASAGAGRGEVMYYDQRLFNQDIGMDSGFAADDQYNLYDKGLFTPHSTLYRPKKDEEEADPFGLDQFLTEVKKGKKVMDKVGGGGGTMKASGHGGSFTRDGHYRGSGRTCIHFDRGH